MTLPVDPVGVYDLLAADATLLGLLGTYTTKQGTTMPAIAVLWPGESLPTGTTMTGVEVAISRGTTGTPEPHLTGGETMSRVIRLYVTQWTVTSGGQNLEAAMVRIAQLLPGATWQPVEAPNGLTGLGQYAVRWEAGTVDRWTD